MGIFDDLLVNRRNLHGEQLAQQVIARLATHTSVDIVSFDILKKECDNLGIIYETDSEKIIEQKFVQFAE